MAELLRRQSTVPPAAAAAACRRRRLPPPPAARVWRLSGRLEAVGTPLGACFNAAESPKPGGEARPEALESQRSKAVTSLRS